MTPERWQKINEVFQSVVELESAEREEYLEKACGEDESLRRQVETLLEADDDAGDFIAGNVAGDVSHLFTKHDEPTLSGQNLEHYEIISILGIGGMGKVYLAKDTKLNRPVAVKTLSTAFSNEPSFIKRLQTEARAAATLNHPNVATIYSVEEASDKRIFITMEYVEGKPLSAAIPDGGLDLTTFLELFIPLADALAHAHEKGIVHRDIKPGNIIVTPAGTPKILDFGLARIEEKEIHEHSTLHLTRTGQILGTPAYMSPEQAEGKTADYRTDLFSFGVVMYEAITGFRPFSGDSYAEIVSKLLKVEPKNISEIKPEIPFLLNRLIMKCLSKQPHRRYQSMSEVRVILKEIKSAIESGNSLTKSVNRMVVSERRNYAGSIVISAICLLGLLLGGYAFWKWFQPEEKSAAVTKFSIEPPKGQELSIFEATISPDGRKIVFPSRQAGVFTLFLRSLDDFEAKPIAGTEQARVPFFSPDSEWIGFTTGEKGLKKIPLAGGIPLIVCESCTIKSHSIWTKDDKIIYCDDEGVKIISANGGTPESLTSRDEKSDEKAHREPQVLPDGKNLLFTIDTSKNSKLAVVSMETKEIKYLPDIGESWLGKYISTGHIVFARGQQLMAMPFDAEKLEVSGKPVPVIADIFPFSPNFQITENGTLVYLPVVGQKNNSLVSVDRNGADTPLLEKKGDYSSPRFSPDGKHIAVTLENDIWVFETDSGRGLRLTTEGKNKIPLWFRDGKTVIYTTEKDGIFTVYKKNSDGTGEAEKLLTSENSHSAYSIHPTENLLALTASKATGNTDIVIESLDDKNLTTFIGTSFIEDTPRFSPDGKWLVYFSMETGESQVYAQNWETKGNKIPVTKNGGLFPVWSPDGKEIFYRKGNKFYTAQIQTGEELKIGATQFLFEGKYLTSYDISPDGKKFLMVKNEQGSMPKHLNVILNWMDEFREKIKTEK